MDKPKLIFAGTPEFAAVALKALLTAGYDIVAVYSQPDRPAGRGRKLTASPVKLIAQQYGIPVEQPPNFKAASTLERLMSYQADLMIVAAYGLLLPEVVLNAPRLGCLNIHASLLPRWRGAAPIQRAILAGDEETGITIMQMDTGLDTGAMLLKKITPIGEQDTASSLHDRLAILGGKAILEALQLLFAHKLIPQKQDETQATYANKLQKDEAWIDWNTDARQIHRQIRAFNPWPVSQTQYQNQIIRIHEAEVVIDTNSSQAGEILAYDKRGLIVACQSGILRIIKCQLPGSKAMRISALHNGHPHLFHVGTCFSMPAKKHALS